MSIGRGHPSKKTCGARHAHRRCGAADRGRTGTVLLPRDFKSLVSAYSTTAAYERAKARCLLPAIRLGVMRNTSSYPETPARR